MNIVSLLYMGYVVAVAAVLAVVLTLLNHSRPAFAVQQLAPDRIVVETKNASANASGMVRITLAENQELQIKANLTGESAVRVDVFPADADGEAKPVTWGKFVRTDRLTASLAAGDYAVRATAEKGATGEVTISASSAA